MIEHITSDTTLLAIILRSEFSEPGIHFFTPPEFSQQLAFMQHQAGKVIEAHRHNEVVREVKRTQEVLVIRRGRLRVDFYDSSEKYLESRVLVSGDVILLADGGHGFEALDDLEMIEIKQGPFAGDTDKTRFAGVSFSELLVVCGE